jgi:kynurenine formamidase
VRFAKDYVGLDFHNAPHSHIDALSHVVYRKRLYQGLPEDNITSDGAQAESISLLRDGLVGRGVLLDIPALHEMDRLEPGARVRTGELEAAEAKEETPVRVGDILLVRTGGRKAGLHPEAARFLSGRQVVALGSDGNNDTDPSAVEGVGFPIHALAINAMGVHLMDYLDLDQLADVCATLGRWEFLIVVAPLRVEGGTGSPVNPIAIF